MIYLHDDTIHRVIQFYILEPMYILLCTILTVHSFRCLHLVCTLCTVSGVCTWYVHVLHLIFVHNDLPPWWYNTSRDTILYLRAYVYTLVHNFDYNCLIGETAYRIAGFECETLSIFELQVFAKKYSQRCACKLHGIRNSLNVIKLACIACVTTCIRNRKTPIN